MSRRTGPPSERGTRGSRLLKALSIGAAAIGLSAVANAWLARRQRRLEPPDWGRLRRYAWTYGEIAFQRQGRGTPLTLLHSFGPGHDAEEWRSAAELLAQQRQIFVPDLLGWGRADKPRLRYDAGLYTRLLIDFLEDVVGNRTVIVASRHAASYAVQVAVERPELVRALALVVPAGIGDPCDEARLPAALVRSTLRLPVVGTSLLHLLTSRSGTGLYLNRKVFRHSEQVDAARLEHQYRSSHQPGSHSALAAYLAGDLDHSVAEIGRHLQSPLWLGWGRHATHPPVEAADLWLRMHPDASLEIFEECGNLPHLEQSAAFAHRLTPFLDAIQA